MISYYADFLANCNFIVAILISTYTCSIYIHKACIHDQSYTLTYVIYIYIYTDREKSGRWETSKNEESKADHSTNLQFFTK